MLVNLTFYEWIEKKIVINSILFSIEVFFLLFFLHIPFFVFVSFDAREGEKSTVVVFSTQWQLSGGGVGVILNGLYC